MTRDSTLRKFMTSNEITSVQKIGSHKKSINEAFVNSFGGYPIGYGLGQYFPFPGITFRIPPRGSRTSPSLRGIRWI